MKGLEISRRYFTACGLPMLQKEFSDYTQVIAAGLAGQGSECLGFDDEISRDHDWGPGFCLCLPQKYYDEIGGALQLAYDALPGSNGGCTDSFYTPERRKRMGVHSIEEFYSSLIGYPRAPDHNLEWLRVPEHYFAMAVNGEVFCDPLGEFTKIRNILAGFFPEDLLKKKLAGKCAAMGQAGQYNYARCIRRRDFAAAALTCSRFVTAALGALYLLNGRYMPFYKWAFRGAEELPEPEGCAEELKKLILLSDVNESVKKALLIERVCIQISKEVIRRGWSRAGDSFMQFHAEQIMEHITDPVLRSLPVMAGES